jgi:cyclophilin family peptidyl-prolyl cis-trans isomerase
MISLFRRMFRPHKVSTVIKAPKHSKPGARLRLESLEDRLVLTAPSLVNPGPIFVPTGQTIQVPLDGSDADGDNLTFTAISDNANVTLSIPTGNPSLRLQTTINSVAQDDMILQLFQDLTPNTVAQISSLVNNGFYDTRIFHRIIPDFVAQFGNNAANQPDDSTPTIDDEYHPDLTFSFFGQLAMAKTPTDDSGRNQIFITDVDLNVSNPAGNKRPPQHLNFDHTIFGQLTEGLGTLSNIIAEGTAGGTPQQTVAITNADIFVDMQNGVLRVKAAPGFTGTANITVTVEDENGETSQQMFTVTVVPDTDDGTANGEVVNDKPFLGPVPTQTAISGTPLTFQIPFTDIDTDDEHFFASGSPGDLLANGLIVNQPDNASVTIDQDTGMLTITPDVGFTGQIQLAIGVRDTAHGDALLAFDTQTITVNVVASDSEPRAVKRDNKLFIRGTADQDIISVELNGSSLVVKTSHAGEAKTFDVAAVQRIIVKTGNGDDHVTIADAVTVRTKLSGGKGDDELQAGPGAAIIRGNQGDDHVMGGAADDRLKGGKGNDLLEGAGGLDILRGKLGDDMVIGGEGSDKVRGGEGGDHCDGGAGDDRVVGMGGDDFVFGGLGADKVRGGKGENEYGPADATDSKDGFNQNRDIRNGTFTDEDLLGDRMDQVAGAFGDTSAGQIQSGDIDYEALGFINPPHVIPSYGPHHQNPIATGVSASEREEEDVLANLEIGHIWITFDISLIGADDDRLRDLVNNFGANSGIVLSPRASQDVNIVLTSWARQMVLHTFDEATIRDFIFANRAHGVAAFASP